jgi:ferrous iron transport protein A
LVLAIDRAHFAAYSRAEQAVIVRSTLPLALAEQGALVRITRLLGGRGMALRLTELGLNVGSEVRIAHRHGGQLVVVRGDTRLALGAGIAHKVLVTPIGAGDERREA